MRINCALCRLCYAIFDSIFSLFFAFIIPICVSINSNEVYRTILCKFYSNDYSNYFVYNVIFMRLFRIVIIKSRVFLVWYVRGLAYCSLTCWQRVDLPCNSVHYWRSKESLRFVRTINKSSSTLERQYSERALQRRCKHAEFSRTVMCVRHLNFSLLLGNPIL